MQDHDIQKVRIAGMFAFGFGVVLLVLSLLASLVGLFNGLFNDAGQFAQAAIGAVTAIIMASTMLSCGATMASIRPSHVDPELLRLTWTALFAVMFLGGVISLWLVPALTVVASLVLLAQLLVREAVIRLTTA